jgi:cleavage and polyadenylation specificity factor subunit 4
MEFLIANVDQVYFKIERDLEEQYGALPIQFPGMDSKKRHFF